MIAYAMVLAAGRGNRLRPQTDSLPKPLFEIGGKALIDHVLDRLDEAGVEQAVVNLSHLGALIESHLAGRETPRIAFSREPERLDTGGGVAQALPQLGDHPFYVVNGKLLWRDGETGALARLAQAWDDAAMDALLLVVPVARAIAARPKPGETAPWLFAGIQILHPRLFDEAPAGRFSLNLLYDRAMAAGRLFGVVHEDGWHHVATPEGLAQARTWFES